MTEPARIPLPTYLFIIHTGITFMQSSYSVDTGKYCTLSSGSKCKIPEGVFKLFKMLNSDKVFFNLEIKLCTSGFITLNDPFYQSSNEFQLLFQENIFNYPEYLST